MTESLAMEKLLHSDYVLTLRSASHAEGKEVIQRGNATPGEKVCAPAQACSRCAASISLKHSDVAILPAAYAHASQAGKAVLRYKLTYEHSSQL